LPLKRKPCCRSLACGFNLVVAATGDKIAIRRPVPLLPLNRERTLADSMCMVGWLCRSATDGRRSPVRRLVDV